MNTNLLFSSRCQQPAGGQTDVTPRGHWHQFKVMTRDQDSGLNNRQNSSATSVINCHKKGAQNRSADVRAALPRAAPHTEKCKHKQSYNSSRKTGTSNRRPRSSGNAGSEPVAHYEALDDRPPRHRCRDARPEIPLDDLGSASASALPSKKAILAQGSNSNRKKLQLQFSIQKDSDEEDYGECVFFDNPATATLLSEADEDEVITRVVNSANITLEF